jgi:Domain of unknown function (DUF4150)/GHH signature containing HNH/Endo VII superfamily nuclease toxin  2
MANEVYANGRELSCKAGSGKSIASFPDVCFTPPQTPATPPGVPIPYPNTGMTSDCTEGSKTVQISGQEIMLKDKSYFKKSTGDEAGSAPKKGVVSSKNMGKVYFTMWSMDVKFEGENVVRHLDMTTHNHGSAANTPPWPFQDAAALGKGSPCNKEPPKDYADQVKANCTAPPEECKKPACCKARKCMLVPGVLEPKSARKCCGKKTPHHIIPVQDHYGEEGARNWDSAAAKKAALPRGSKTYHEDKAPAICVEGQDHRNPRKQHGRIGRGYAYMRNKLLRETKSDTYQYEDVAQPAAEMVATEMKCDAECIKAQMDDYHNESSKAPLRRSKQPEKGGASVYARREIADADNAFDN